MKLMNSLALRHLKQNKKQTFAAFLAITLAVSMLVAISTFIFSVYESMLKFAEANDLMSTMKSSFSSLTTIGVLLGAVIVGAAVIVISNAFNIQASERVKQFGILKSVGATDEQIKSTVTAESNWLSLIGIPGGIILGHLLCFAAMALLRSNVDSDAVGTTMEYTVRFNIIAVILASALGYISVRFASSMTAAKVSKLSAIEAIRQTDEVKIESGKLKTSKTIGKLFGFEGTLASKQLKRNKRKFRVTVLSLTTSIVLFLAAFSFGDTLIKTALGAFANTGANVVSEVSGSSKDFSKFDSYAQMLKSNNPQKMYTLYSYRNDPMADGGEWFNVIIMDDADYNDYCKRSGVKQGANILLKYNDNPSVPFSVTLPNLGKEISVTEQAEITNPYLKSVMYVAEPNIIIPRVEAARLGLNINAAYYITAQNATDFIAKIKPAAAQFGFDSVYHHNTDEYTRDLQRMYAMLMAFVYCFIGMLALIGATSVLATINNNINLRKSEFATLQAVGMETKKLRKMLNIESLLYGLKSLLYGLPIGLILSYLMHVSAISGNTRLDSEAAANFHYEIPYIGILVCVIGVFAVNFVSMYFAAGKMRRSNIAETMREVNN